MEQIFSNRRDAGRLLAKKLEHYANFPDVVVLALPRGGVPVAYEIARAIQAPLDVFIVRKLGVPGHEELAMGAIASGGIQVMNHDIVGRLGINSAAIAAVIQKEQHEIARQETQFREARAPLACRGSVVILVDDGLATGATMRVAIAALKTKEPARLVVAVPVGALETCRQIQREVDEFACGYCPENLHAVGAWYEDFSPVSDETVRHLLKPAPVVAGNPS
jgi:predicted phosphoribosyltransferase